MADLYIEVDPLERQSLARAEGEVLVRGARRHQEVDRHPVAANPLDDLGLGRDADGDPDAAPRLWSRAAACK
jgi:hypothetical protein